MIFNMGSFSPIDIVYEYCNLVCHILTRLTVTLDNHVKMDEQATDYWVDQQFWF